MTAKSQECEDICSEKHGKAQYREGTVTNLIKEKCKDSPSRCKAVGENDQQQRTEKEACCDVYAMYTPEDRDAFSKKRQAKWDAIKDKSWVEKLEFFQGKSKVEPLPSPVIRVHQSATADDEDEKEKS